VTIFAGIWSDIDNVQIEDYYESFLAWGVEIMKYSFASADEFFKSREKIRSHLAAICPAEAERLFVALNEALNNAFIHGTKEDGENKITASIARKENVLVITVRDGGVGFNHRRDGDAGENMWEEGGRGLEIIRHFTDGVKFNRRGNEITMHKKLSAVSRG
jgi:serine/threonine-protein kinase RsbW